MIRRLGEGRWSAPLFVSAKALRAGAIAGAEKVATVALSLTRDLTEHLQEGRSPQLGADISLRLGTAVEAVSGWGRVAGGRCWRAGAAPRNGHARRLLDGCHPAAAALLSSTCCRPVAATPPEARSNTAAT